MSSNALILHAGAATATLADVAAVSTPEPQENWTPIPHHVLVTTVIDQLQATGLIVTAQAFGLWQDGARFFGTLALRNGSNHDDYQLVVGLRNSHDRSFAAGLVLGSRVFVCDNLAFSGEVKFSRKHTVNIVRDLPGLASTAIARLHDLRGWQDERISAYKQHQLTDGFVHDFLIRTLDANVAKPTMIPQLLSEWRNPTHEEFAPRTAWSLFNAYTETFKGAVTQLSRRTITLHGMMDGVVGLAAPKAIEEDIGEIEDADYEIVA